MMLPIVNPFATPYELWSTREPTCEEILQNGNHSPVRENLIERISDSSSAATYIAKSQQDNRLGDHVKDALDKSCEYKAWKKAMPRRTPNSLSTYQREYPNFDPNKVHQDIDKYGKKLSKGQFLFHGGMWRGDPVVLTDRPLSTSLCPQVALRNAEYRGKAYDNDRIDLFVLNVAEAATKAFVFKNKGTTMGHELEVLFSAGARLNCQSEYLIRKDYPVGKLEQPTKLVPIYVLDVQIT